MFESFRKRQSQCTLMGAVDLWFMNSTPIAVAYHDECMTIVTNKITTTVEGKYVLKVLQRTDSLLITVNRSSHSSKQVDTEAKQRR